VKNIRHVKDVGMRINGGFFVFRQEIFDWMKPGEELVQEPFQRLAAAGRLVAYPYDGFWACLDTFKDKQLLEDLTRHGQSPGRSGSKRTPGPPRAGPQVHDMNRVSILEEGGAPKRILALGPMPTTSRSAAGGTILRLAAEHSGCRGAWVVGLCATPRRAEDGDALRLRPFLEGSPRARVVVRDYPL